MSAPVSESSATFPPSTLFGAMVGHSTVRGAPAVPRWRKHRVANRSRISQGQVQVARIGGGVEAMQTLDTSPASPPRARRRDSNAVRRRPPCCTGRAVPRASCTRRAGISTIGRQLPDDLLTQVWTTPPASGIRPRAAPTRTARRARTRQIGRWRQSHCTAACTDTRDKTHRDSSRNVLRGFLEGTPRVVEVGELNSDNGPARKSTLRHGRERQRAARHSAVRESQTMLALLVQETASTAQPPRPHACSAGACSRASGTTRVGTPRARSVALQAARPCHGGNPPQPGAAERSSSRRRASWVRELTPSLR